MENQVKIIDRIVENVLLYVQDEFGNFVVSEVMN